MNKRRRWKAKARRARTWPRCVRNPFLRFHRDAFVFEWPAVNSTEGKLAELLVVSGGRGFRFERIVPLDRDGRVPLPEDKNLGENERGEYLFRRTIPRG